MQLVRLGRPGFSRAENAVYLRDEDNDLRVEMYFDGPSHQSKFRVDVTWADVEKLITEFSAMKEPRAIAIQQAKLLAAGARRAGWISRAQESN